MRKYINRRLYNLSKSILKASKLIYKSDWEELVDKFYEDKGENALFEDKTKTQKQTQKRWNLALGYVSCCRARPADIFSSGLSSGAAL